MPPSHPVNRRVLQIRHLPTTFNQEQSTALLKKHGAHTVSFRRKNAFAFFGDELLARHALHALHQLHLNDSVLLVTFARADDKCIPFLPPVLPQSQHSKDEEMIRKLHAIAPHLGLDYALNPMVKYKYPPINDTILANVCEALRQNSNFYTQVLHLMNKMSMTPPFRRATAPSRVFQKPSREKSTQVTSESESDLSDIENFPRRKKPKRRTDSPDSRPKPVRKPKIEIPLSSLLPESAPVDVNQCFDVSCMRKLEIVPIASVSTHEDSTEFAPGEGFGRLDPPQPEEESTPVAASRFDFDCGVFVDLESMERLPITDSLDHPAFRNYEEGDPCVRLYLKNLHKSTNEEDLFRIFGQFVPHDDAERAIFDIKLMKTGRMRGQAFVTYGSVTVAVKALESTSRLILNGKPIAVQFARAARSET